VGYRYKPTRSVQRNGSVLNEGALFKEIFLSLSEHPPAVVCGLLIFLPLSFRPQTISPSPSPAISALTPGAFILLICSLLATFPVRSISLFFFRTFHFLLSYLAGGQVMNAPLCRFLNRV